MGLLRGFVYDLLLKDLLSLTFPTQTLWVMCGAPEGFVSHLLLKDLLSLTYPTQTLWVMCGAPEGVCISLTIKGSPKSNVSHTNPVGNV